MAQMAHQLTQEEGSRFYSRAYYSTGRFNRRHIIDRCLDGDLKSPFLCEFNKRSSDERGLILKAIVIEGNEI